MDDIRQLAQYAPAGIETRWYEAWERSGLFAPREGGGEPFVITLPPPNVTGTLTIGHCLGNSIQDTLVRWMRMRGRPALWVPGTDHASISTEQVVTRRLRSEGIEKRELGREGFLQKVWEWKEQTHGRITQQMRRLGCSLDWSREAFTMDEARNRAVTHAFLALKDKGLIYRGLYLVNWCPSCLTAISDDEVDHLELQGRLWSIRYPFADGEGHVTVATTRPETLFGDVAVAVNPDDPERAPLAGRRVRLPLTDREIPIILDRHADPEKGTGFVKITPAHDPNDFEVGRRHDLPRVVCLDERGVMTEAAGRFAGLSREECRRAALAALAEQGLLAQEKPHLHQVGHHDRCGTAIEPHLSRQWFLRMGELAQPAVAAVRDGTITLLPERWVGVYFNWLENIRDWCISRQLWWGHRIPVWYCRDCEREVAAESPPERCPDCGGGLVQDPDVLDTWFSSWLWTFSPLGWPAETEDLRRFHPTSVLVTAADIIFFWVARMIMASYEFRGEPPFREVLFTGIVRDEQGRKMSKSLGNSPDPIELIDRYGADALRCSLVMLTPTGQDIFFSEASLEVGRNFGNKIFQATKLILLAWDAAGLPSQASAAPESGPAATSRPLAVDALLAAGGPGEADPAGALAGLWRATFDGEPPLAPRPEEVMVEDLWLLNRLCATVRDCNDALERRRLNDAAYAAFNFFRHELCDWYLEAIKPRLRDPESRGTPLLVAVLALAHSYKLLHPVMPFITEELWSRLPPGRGFLMVSPYPTFVAEPPFAAARERFAQVMETVGVVRNLRTEAGVPPGRRGRVVLRTPDAARRDLLRQDAGLVALLAKLEAVEVVDEAPPLPSPAAAGVAGAVEVFLPMAGLIDLEKERQRLQKELQKVEGWIEGSRRKLANEQFTASAPAEIVQRQRDQLAQNEATAAGLRRQLEALG